MPDVEGTRHPVRKEGYKSIEGRWMHRGMCVRVCGCGNDTKRWIRGVMVRKGVRIIWVPVSARGPPGDERGATYEWIACRKDERPRTPTILRTTQGRAARAAPRAAHPPPGVYTTGGAPRLGRGRMSLEPREGVSMLKEVGETGEGSGEKKKVEPLVEVELLAEVDFDFAMMREMEVVKGREYAKRDRRQSVTPVPLGSDRGRDRVLWPGLGDLVSILAGGGGGSQTRGE
ncbi:hypothetical protein DFH07DRAFT_764652 [Mycena maculata]|uniref:Uncharacterized protein n=1 Tax=Mycena maculata TaxID=230809 RepID=A0AAD7KBN6_9AGAR|nr:hypothetical protein DFH07DRAFT_764652 [Mycena maculata]